MSLYGRKSNDNKPDDVVKLFSIQSLKLTSYWQYIAIFISICSFFSLYTVLDIFTYYGINHFALHLLISTVFQFILFAHIAYSKSRGTVLVALAISIFQLGGWLTSTIEIENYIDGTSQTYFARHVLFDYYPAFSVMTYKVLLELAFLLDSDILIELVTSDIEKIQKIQHILDYLILIISCALIYVKKGPRQQ